MIDTGLAEKKERWKVHLLRYSVPIVSDCIYSRMVVNIEAE